VTVPVASPGSENSGLATELQAATQRVLGAGSYVLGPEVTEFEREFAAFVGARSAVGVASGTDALTLALAACGVGPGDEVITASHTAGATAAAILHTGATPVLVDIEPTTYTISVPGVAAAVGERTRAIVPVHLYGGAAALDGLRELARRHDLLLIEDCAQAHGTRYRGEHVGARADAAAFSFYPTKNLGAIGDGGAVVTSRPEVTERLRSLREYGWDAARVSRELGWNSRLDELQAALLRVKLRHLPELLAQRRSVASSYAGEISSPLLTHPSAPPDVEHSFHLYVVRCARRDALAAHLQEAGIGTAVHYRVPVHRQPAYAERCRAHDMTETDRAAREILSLPIYPGLTAAAVERTAAAAQAFVSE
jgi:dTDP-3-amino-3,4,6-trideoxy-alpha-D-glucose transaminase